MQLWWDILWTWSLSALKHHRPRFCFFFLFFFFNKMNSGESLALVNPVKPNVFARSLLWMCFAVKISSFIKTPHRAWVCLKFLKMWIVFLTYLFTEINWVLYYVLFCSVSSNVFDKYLRKYLLYSPLSSR